MYSYIARVPLGHMDRMNGGEDAGRIARFVCRTAVEPQLDSYTFAIYSKHVVE